MTRGTPAQKAQCLEAIVNHLRSRRRRHRPAVRRGTRRYEPLRRSAHLVRAVHLHVRPAAEVAPALGAPERGILAERVEVPAVVAVALRRERHAPSQRRREYADPPRAASCTAEDDVA